MRIVVRLCILAGLAWCAFQFRPVIQPNILLQAWARLTPKPPAFNLNDTIAAASRMHGVDPKLIHSIVKAESAGNPDAVSGKGAVGLMQLMPQTAADLGADPADPEQNIHAGTRYLAWLLQRYHMYRNSLARAVAAYNAGPGNVDHYKGVPPFKETRQYVTRVLGYYGAGTPTQSERVSKRHVKAAAELAD